MLMKEGYTLEHYLKFCPIDELPYDKPYRIMGVQKCGSKTLAYELRRRGHIVIESEGGALMIDKAENFDYQKHHCVIITRNPLDRAESDYIYFHFKNPTIKQACDHSFFRAIAQMWEGYVFSLEYLKTLPNVEWKNKTSVPGVELPTNFRERAREDLKLDRFRL